MTKEKAPETKITIDFETRSLVSPKTHGTWGYAAHPSTDIFCLAYKLDDLVSVIWVNEKFFTHAHFEKVADQMRLDLTLRFTFSPDQVLDYIAAADIVEAHNADFERAIWRRIMAPRYGWPDIPNHKWRCSAAKAAAHALPRALEKASPALFLTQQKDSAGHKIMMKMTKPRRPRKGEDPSKIYWHDKPEDFLKLFKYCIQDVETEHCLSANLSDLSPAEQEVWHLDQKINERGVAVDLQTVETVIELIEEHERKLAAEVPRLSCGVLESTSQVGLMTEFCNLPDLRKDTVEEALKNDGLPSNVRRLLEIRQSLGLTSTAKYYALRAYAEHDGRARGTMLYHGASTGRFCLTGDHEVLTPEGWISLSKWTGGKIMQWAPLSNSLFWENADANHFQCSEEKMVNVTGRFLKTLVTPDHAIPYYSSRGIFHKCQAGNLRMQRHDVAISGLYRPQQFIDPIETRIIVMTQADGSICEDTNQGRQITFGFRKERKIQRAINLLRQAAIPYKIKKYGPTTRIVIPWRDAPCWMWEAKNFTTDILNHDPREFIDELQYWDSHIDRENSTTGFEYTTTDSNNAEWVATMAHLCGHAASITIRKRAKTKWNLSYRVYIRKQIKTRVAKEDIEYQNFSGEVYCPTTISGYFLVRYKGLIHITGNTGRGLQPHNFPRKGLKEEELEFALSCITDRQTTWIDALWGDIMELGQSLLRPMLIAGPGKDLLCADFAGIEARVVLWYAREYAALKMLREGTDIYCDLASEIYSRPCTKADKTERQVGKQGILGLGFGMGANKFRITCRDQAKVELEMKMARLVVKTYRRKKYVRVPQFWYDQEEAATTAVLERETIISDRITWSVDDRFLYCTLASGRRLCYPFPKVEPQSAYLFPAVDEDGEETSLLVMGPAGMIGMLATNRAEEEGLTITGRPRQMIKQVLTFMSWADGQWRRESTYGGKLTENIVQATARDLMVAAMLRLEENGYPVVMTVHDEIVSEVPENTGDLKEFERLMAEVPVWAAGCPVGVEGWRGKRYRK